MCLIWGLKYKLISLSLKWVLKCLIGKVTVWMLCNDFQTPSLEFGPFRHIVPGTGAYLGTHKFSLFFYHNSKEPWILYSHLNTGTKQTWIWFHFILNTIIAIETKYVLCFKPEIASLCAQLYTWIVKIIKEGYNAFTKWVAKQSTSEWESFFPIWNEIILHMEDTKK